MLFNTIYDIVGIVFYVIQTLLIVMMVLGLLLAFNVVNTRNQFVMSIWQALNALLEPLLKPLRRVLPDTGGVDFSPLLLIVLMQVIMTILGNVAAATL
ncbi:YggT family protein [Novosphingobium sp. TH158]|uniref:YggT family protein n=1 Tax=Novosphingobium sp. TH158 TaxID=2067455 RepID=UPI000C79B70F|nr:YggT family protein [Novosphingobium sp. TH158]PLK27514.1 YggT family protein [Novosphingobium sp. TH158]